MRLFFLITLFTATALALDDTSSVKQKAQTCTACHGENGISPNELWPNLAGQKKAYLLKQMQEFQNGPRFDPLMSPVSRMLSPQEMKDLATYYSELGAK